MTLIGRKISIVCRETSPHKQSQRLILRVSSLAFHLQEETIHCLRPMLRRRMPGMMERSLNEHLDYHPGAK